MQQQFDPKNIQKAPKLFCESINIGYSEEFFVMLLRSGNQGQLYALTPAHTKRLYQYLGHQIKEFEEKHGEIDATWDPNVPSPVQRMNPPTEGS